MANNLSDKNILEAIISTDKIRSDQALKQVYRTFFSTIESYILANSGNTEHAADIFQEAVVVWYNLVKSGKFRLDSSIKTFLYSVAKNLWLKQLRKKRQNSSQIMAVETSAEFEMNEYGEHKISVTQLLKITLNELGDGCQKVLVGFYFDKLSMNGIMKSTGLSSEQAARNKKYKCMLQLMKIFESKGITKEIVFG